MRFDWYFYLESCTLRLFEAQAFLKHLWDIGMPLSLGVYVVPGTRYLVLSATACMLQVTFCPGRSGKIRFRLVASTYK
jgi:hypothetical protein